MSGGKEKLSLKDEDVSKILMATGHIGKANVNFQMLEYIYSKRPDGIPILDIKKMWEKILLAARVIVAIKVPSDVVAVSNNEFCQRAVLKFCKHVGSTPIAGRFTPGTLTNQITSAFREPRLLIASEPKFDHQSITEASYVSIPVIAFCNTDANLKHIDIAIPCNTESANSIGLFWWILAREVLRMRGTISRDELWKDDKGVVMVDTFFYRDPDEIQAQEKESAMNVRTAPDEYELYGVDTDTNAPPLGGAHFGTSIAQGAGDIEESNVVQTQVYTSTEHSYPAIPVNAKPSENWDGHGDDW